MRVILLVAALCFLFFEKLKSFRDSFRKKHTIDLVMAANGLESKQQTIFRTNMGKDYGTLYIKNVLKGNYQKIVTQGNESHARHKNAKVRSRPAKRITRDEYRRKVDIERRQRKKALPAGTRYSIPEIILSQDLFLRKHRQVCTQYDKNKVTGDILITHIPEPIAQDIAPEILSGWIRLIQKRRYRRKELRNHFLKLHEYVKEFDVKGYCQCVLVRDFLTLNKTDFSYSERNAITRKNEVICLVSAIAL